jgi:hypothetical protein
VPVLAEEVAETPVPSVVAVVEPVATTVEPLDVLPEAGTATSPAPADEPFNPAEVRIYRYNVYAMLVNACRKYEHKGLIVMVGLGFVPVTAACAAVLCFLLTWAAYGLTTGLGIFLGPGTNSLLYALLLVVFGYAKLAKNEFDEARVRFSYEGDTPQQLQLGKLDEVLDIANPAVTGFFLGACFGFQVGLLYFTFNHGGLGEAGGLGHCILLTVDNLCHGIFLDTCELYDINFAGRVEHGWVSATVYYIFRIAFEASAFLLAYQIYQRRHARHLFDDYPENDDDRAQFADWLVKVFGDKHGWPRRYFDEFMFLLIAGYYLQGNNERVRQLTQEFPRLRVASDVRAHFVDEKGTVIFESVS